MPKSTLSPLQKAFNALRKAKRSACAGKGTAAGVKKAAGVYIKKAVAKGQTKTEAQKKANRVINGSCKNVIGATRGKAKKAGVRKKVGRPRKRAAA